MKGFKYLFSLLPSEKPPQHLFEKIEGLIRAYRARTIRLRFAIASLSGVASGIACVLGIRAFAQAAAESGFFAYASLSLSDTAIVVKNFSIFILSLFESLPVTETAILFLAIAALGTSIVALRAYVPEYRALLVT